MKTQFTLGTWKINGNSIKDEHDNSVCEITRYGAALVPEGQDSPLKLWKGNARLISQAPAMYEALKEVNEMFNNHFGITDNDDGGNPTHDKIRGILSAVEGEG